MCVCVVCVLCVFVCVCMVRARGFEILQGRYVQREEIQTDRQRERGEGEEREKGRERVREREERVESISHRGPN